MKKDPEIFLKHIMECIGVVKEYTKKVSRDDFLNDQRLQDAVTRRIEIIGEAAKNIPERFKEKHPKLI